MRILLIFISLFFCNSTTLFSQDKIEFGVLSEKEKSFTVYQKDTTANAVVLYERGDNYFQVINQRIMLIKDYHVKIKILNKNGFEHGNISIPYYHNKKTSEIVTKIKAIVHNNNTIQYLNPDAIFITDISEKWKEKSFTFPNLQVGSIIEYKYKIRSPYIFNFNGWEFQSSIPKLYSEFNAKIPRNYKYNRSLNGSINLDVNEATIEKKCFHIRGFSQAADCEVLKYIMKNIPAFEIAENYMLAKSNYISKLEFELSELKRFDGVIQKFTQSWDAVDREFKNDKDIGRQLTKKGYFEKYLPSNLLNEGTQLAKAKNIFEFVQNHYTWNKDFGIFGKTRVKESFERKTGGVGEINMTLINMLNAAGIDAKLMLSSSRSQGLPTKSHPVMSDFNYFIAYVTINDNNYLLDATDKHTPFGMLPFRALNRYGRVMNFKNESFWAEITPLKENKKQILGMVQLDIKNKNTKTMYNVINTGHFAVNLNKKIETFKESEYLEELENSLEENYEITSYQLTNQINKEKKIKQRLILSNESTFAGETVFLDPFVLKFHSQNPLSQDKRNYPVDFGYPRFYKYQMTFEIPDEYIVNQLPEKKIIKLSENSNTFLKFISIQKNNKVLIFYEFQLIETQYATNDYQALKEIFKQSIDIQNNSLIVLKKK